MLYNITKSIVRWTSDEPSNNRHLELEWNGIVQANYIWYSKDAWISDIVDLNDLAARAG